ncbi:acyl-ACP thioesterase [Anaerotaenia torta]|uniref:acyl-[acyl-carrier-protein] thioesterase n=1 Tax=Anaerotaenia torta TaxID=433293 RepID=UPI003D1B22A2
MYTFQSRIRYSELNHQKGCLNPSSIINYFQDCSTFQSEDMNRGLEFLSASHKVWVMNSWQLQLLRPALLGEEISVSTWPYDFKGFYGYRNFIMKNRQEEVLAVANSIWVYMDTLTQRPARIPADCNGYTIEPPYPMEHADRKIEISGTGETQPPFYVIKSNIDSYHHVNNGQYIKMAEEYLPDDFMIQSMRAEYRMQAVLGDCIIPRVVREEDRYIIALASREDKPYAIVEFTGQVVPE